MTQKQALNLWLAGANDAFDTAKKLYSAKKFDHCLFFVHLALEKILKAVYLSRKNSAPPPIHNLTKLAKTCDFYLSEIEIKQLDEISKFNVSARYDDIKLQFYKKATNLYAETWLGLAEKFYQKFQSAL